MFEKIANDNIKNINNIVEELRRTSSLNEKIYILNKNKHNEELKTILELTYNPYKKYKITEKTVKQGNVESNTYEDFLELAEVLVKSNINDDLRNKTNNFLAQCDNITRDLYKCVLTKDLKIGINSSTINKVWKNLIPSSETGVSIKPMLASKFDFEKPPTGHYSVTEKLDGIRCMAICREDGVELYSRQGKLIEGCIGIELNLFKLRYKIGKDIVFDGELLANECDYSNVYKETVKRVKNKNKVKEDIHFTIFDMLTIEEFENKKCYRTYDDRLSIIKLIEENFGSELMYVEFIKSLYIGNNSETLLQLLEHGIFIFTMLKKHKKKLIKQIQII